MIEVIVFRTIGGLFITFGFGKFWARQPWVQKYRKTYAHRQAIKARKARDRAIVKMKDLITKNKIQNSTPLDGIDE